MRTTPRPDTITLQRTDAEVLASAGLAFVTLLRLRERLQPNAPRQPIGTVSINGGPRQSLEFGPEQTAEIEQAVRNLRQALGWRAPSGPHR